MLKVGQKVVCIDASPALNAKAVPMRLIEGQVYTVRAIHTEPHIDGYGVRLVELENPSIVWDDGDECEWSYRSGRFEPVAEPSLPRVARLERQLP